MIAELTAIQAATKFLTTGSALNSQNGLVVLVLSYKLICFALDI